MDLEDGNKPRSFQVEVMCTARAGVHGNSVLALSSSWREKSTLMTPSLIAKLLVKNVRVKNTSAVFSTSTGMI